MKQNPIDKLWEAFRDSNIPLGAPPEHYQDMKIAFYTGASSILSLLNAIEDADVNASIAVEILNEAAVGCEMFHKEILTILNDKLVN